MNLFSVLNDEEMKYLTNHSKKVSVLKNDILHSIKDEITNVSLVLSGRLKVVKFSIDGNQQVINYVNENNTFGEAFIFSGRNYPAYVIAEQDSTILEIPRSVIFTLFKNEKFLLSFIKEISNKVLNLSNIIEIISTKSIEERLLMYFSILSSEQKTDVIFFNSKQKVANDIGSVREVVSKRMKLLEQKGFIRILDRNHIKLLFTFT